MARSTRPTSSTKASQQRGFGINTLILFLIVVAFLVAVTFPLWRNIIIALDPVNRAFPSLSEADREVLRQLPAEDLDAILALAAQNQERATDTAFASQRVVTTDDPFSAGGLPPQRQGQFVALDLLHQAQGSAVTYDLGSNQRVLRLENFQTRLAPVSLNLADNTPGGVMELRLAFANQTEFTVEGGVPADSADIGALKANEGNQTYNLPPGVNPANYRSLVLYSAKYGIVVSYAVLN